MASHGFNAAAKPNKARGKQGIRHRQESSFLLRALKKCFWISIGKALAEQLPKTIDHLREDRQGYDYDLINESWAAHPDTSDWADLTPPESAIDDEQHKAEASVFYVYPSGYFGFRLNSPKNPKLWQDPLGVVGDFLADVTGGMVHASVFNGVGKVFTPRYRQMTAWGFMLPHTDERRQHALEVALTDVERAFEHFLKVNHGGPFILASHSQGSIVLCRMLKRRYQIGADDLKRAELQNLVVAYLVSADLSDGDCGPMVRQCNNPLDLKCFVHYNVFMDDGDRAKFILASEDKNLTCVNPLSFRADEAHVLHTDNPGSRPIFRPIQMFKALAYKIIGKPLTPATKAEAGTTLLNFMSPLEKGLFGAKCHKGVVWIKVKEIASGFWTTGIFPGRNLHGGESSMYYLSTRLNAQQRLKEHVRLLREGTS